MFMFVPAVAIAMTRDAVDIDAAVAKLYSVISGPAGQKRDWDAFRAMFAPDARMRVSVRRQEKDLLATMTPDDYVTRSGPVIEKSGFFEKELARKTVAYGGLVHVWSTYESRIKPDDAKPFERGINSIQFVKVEGTWKIVSIAWAGETSAGPLPKEFLPGGR